MSTFDMPERRRRTRRPAPTCPHCLNAERQPTILVGLNSKRHCKSPTCDWRVCNGCNAACDHYGNHIHPPKDACTL